MPQKMLPDAVRSETMKQGGIVVKQEKFEGRTEELAGYIFDVTTARNANNFSRTLKEVARHVGSTSKYGADLRRKIEKEKLFGIAGPIKTFSTSERSIPDRTRGVRNGHGHLQRRCQEFRTKTKYPPRQHGENIRNNLGTMFRRHEGESRIIDWIRHSTRKQ